VQMREGPCPFDVALADECLLVCGRLAWARGRERLKPRREPREPVASRRERTHHELARGHDEYGQPRASLFVDVVADFITVGMLSEVTAR
jgi:hypothetical protein